VRFRMLLGLLGTLLATTSRFNRAIQRQVSCHRVIEIGSEDGAVYHYTFENRRISFRRGPAENPSCAVRFPTARHGFRALTAPNRFEVMVEGLHNEAIQIRGDVSLFLWFEGLLRIVVPTRRTYSPSVVVPFRFVSPEEAGEAAKYIIREPEATQLDPAWTAALTQRNKLLIMRVPAGEPLKSHD